VRPTIQKDQLKRQTVEEYLDKGGEINQIPTGHSAYDGEYRQTPLQKELREKANIGNRRSRGMSISINKPHFSQG
jgi:hypothetical protein